MEQAPNQNLVVGEGQEKFSNIVSNVRVYGLEEFCMNGPKKSNEDLFGNNEPNETAQN